MKNHLYWREARIRELGADAELIKRGTFRANQQTKTMKEQYNYTPEYLKHRASTEPLDDETEGFKLKLERISNGFHRTLSEEIIKIKDQAVQAELIKRGWTPPNNQQQ